MRLPSFALQKDRLVKDSSDLFIFRSAAAPALFSTMKKSNVNVDWFRECEFDQSARFLLQSIYLPDLFALLSLAICL